MTAQGQAQTGELAGFTYRYAPGDDALPGAGWTLLLLHGTGGDERQLTGLAGDLLAGAAVLAPRGNVLEGGAPRFFARLALNQFDPAEVERGADALADFVDAATAVHAIDPAKTVALGYSNGANVALAAMTRHPGVLRGAVLLRAMPILPMPPASLDGTDLLALGGGRDPLVPVELFEAMVAEAEAAGARIAPHLQPAAGHELARGDLAAAQEWLSQLTR